MVNTLLNLKHGGASGQVQSLEVELRRRRIDTIKTIGASLLVAATVRVVLGLQAPTSWDSVLTSLTAPMFADPLDPFTTIGALATVVIATAFFDRPINWPGAHEPESDSATRNRAVSAISMKQILVVISFCMCISCWLFLISDVPSVLAGGSLNVLRILSMGSLLMLSANFVATRREEVQLALALAYVRTTADLDTYLQILQKENVRPGISRFYWGLSPALLLLSLAQLAIWLPAGTSWDTLLLATVILIGFGYLVFGPVWSLYLLIRSWAQLRTFNVGRRRFVLTFLYALATFLPILLLIPLLGLTGQFSPVDDQLSPGENPVTNLLTTLGVGATVLLPAVMGWRQIARRGLYDFSTQQVDQARRLSGSLPSEQVDRETMTMA